MKSTVYDSNYYGDVQLEKDSDGDLIITQKLDSVVVSKLNAKYITCEMQKLFPYSEELTPRSRPHGVQKYKGNGNHSWEHVIDSTFRLRVPGGWLYKTSTRGDIRSGATTVFVPVPNAVGYAF